jgi:hypothetical protein
MGQSNASLGAPVGRDVVKVLWLAPVSGDAETSSAEPACQTECGRNGKLASAKDLQREGMAPAQARNAGEVRVAGQPFATMLDGQGGVENIR